MDKLIKSRKFVFGALSLITMIVPMFWPESRAHLDKIIPGVVLAYTMLVLGTTAEDGVRVWAENRPGSAGAATQDIIDAVLEAMKPQPTVTSGSPTVTLDPPADFGNG